MPLPPVIIRHNFTPDDFMWLWARYVFGFNERYHGFRSFAAMLEELQSRQLLELEHDEKSGSYIIRSVHG